MRVDLNSKTPQPAEAGQSGQRANTGSAGKAAQTQVQTEDRAELSVDKARVGVLTAQVNNLPEIRQERVQALGQAIRNGSYQVSPEQTAESIVSEMLGNVA